MLKKVFYIITIVLVFYSCKKSLVKDEIKRDRVLKIFNWEGYIGSKTLENFKNETGIEVKIDYFEDEEEMFAVLRSDLSKYDLVVASDDLIREMILTKILSKIDKVRIEKLKNIDKRYLNLDFDPDNNYSVPYLWGTTGILVNRKYIHEDLNSWKVLFNPRYKNRVSMLNNSYAVYSAAFKVLGLNINPESKEAIDCATDLLLGQSEINHGYYDVLKNCDLMVKEDLWVSQVYSGEGLAAADSNENLSYIIPKEGAPIWLDSFVIPKDSNNKDEAHIFIDYILRPDVIGEISSELWYATPNSYAYKYTDPEILESKEVFPDEEMLKRCEYYRDIGTLSNYLYKRWSEVE